MMRPLKAMESTILVGHCQATCDVNLPIIRVYIDIWDAIPNQKVGLYARNLWLYMRNL